MVQNLIFTNNVTAAIERLTATGDHNLTVWIADVNTARFAPSDARLITIPDGDDNKTLATVTRVWDEMERMGVTRHSLVINLGGGMVCDLGGFAAATFKRGMRFINVPTTLLGAVDAAVGGKTGFNYNGLKNEIGAFAPASDVIISTRYFDTLPIEEMKSGFAEVLKHAMLSDRSEFMRLLDHDFNAPIDQTMISTHPSTMTTCWKGCAARYRSRWISSPVTPTSKANARPSTWDTPSATPSRAWRCSAARPFHTAMPSLGDW